MATMSATDRCLALPETVIKIISFLNYNDQINCLRISSTWYDLACPISTTVFSQIRVTTAADDALRTFSADHSYKRLSRETLDTSEICTLLFQASFPSWLLLLTAPSSFL